MGFLNTAFWLLLVVGSRGAGSNLGYHLFTTWDGGVDSLIFADCCLRRLLHFMDIIAVGRLYSRLPVKLFR